MIPIKLFQWEIMQIDRQEDPTFKNCMEEYKNISLYNNINLLINLRRTIQ